MLAEKTDLIELPIDLSHALLHSLQCGGCLRHLIGEDTQALIERINQRVRKLTQLDQRCGSNFPPAKELLLDLATDMPRHFKTCISFNLIELPNTAHGSIGVVEHFAQ